jgi:hypothetical protein
MAEPTAVRGALADRSGGSAFVLWVVGAAVLVGIGLTGLAFWLITFHWVYLASVLPLAGGGLLLFSRRTGPDHA